MTQITPQRALALFRQMLVIRRCEEELVKAHQAGEVIGPCHTYIGEEAIATGVCAHLHPDDVILSTHRGHGHALAKGVSPAALLAELLGKATGCSGGRGGSMHLFAPEVGLYGTNGIVAGSINLATGAAYAFKLSGSARVSVAFFGDGAVNNGAFHEGLNMAATWQLPVLFVCENNQYATEMTFASSTRNTSVASRASDYALPGFCVDGNDVMAVYEAAQEAIARAREGSGPTLIECLTYRTRPHSEGMRSTGYRDAAEIEAWRARCPIVRWRAQLADVFAIPEERIAQIEREVAEQVAEAMSRARSAPWPDPASVMQHVYVDEG